jgi:hypothetical protein
MLKFHVCPIVRSAPGVSQSFFAQIYSDDVFCAQSRHRKAVASTAASGIQASLVFKPALWEGYYFEALEEELDRLFEQLFIVRAPQTAKELTRCGFKGCTITHPYCLLLSRPDF